MCVYIYIYTETGCTLKECVTSPHENLCTQARHAKLKKKKERKGHGFHLAAETSTPAHLSPCCRNNMHTHWE